ncbi:MAG: dephospho-CoA kinase [Actinobacteria bacterium]|nr:MAG: dephospho-CoA kinase [Actinomycetota bacterium]
MLVVGLTGGIGSGKSTVSRLLSARGAVIVDADVVARRVVEPGGPAYQGVVDRFGPGILAADGTIDRRALAAIVFADPEARADLEAITHPAVGVLINEQLAAEAGTDHVVVLDVPLLVESGRTGTPVIVVDCPPETAIRRLVEQRAMDEADARRRVAAQVSREERLAHADLVIDNSGSPEALEHQVDAAWAWIEGLRAAGEL